MQDSHTDMGCVEAIARVAADFMVCTVKDDSPADVVAEYFQVLENAALGAVVAISIIYDRDSAEIDAALRDTMNYIAGT